MSRRPVRVAVLGSATFALGMRREFDESGFRYIELVEWGPGQLPIPAGEEEGSAELVAAEAERRQIDLLIFGPDPGRPRPGSGSEFNRRVGLACLGRRLRLIDGNQFYEEVFGHVPLGTIDSAWYLFLVHPGFRPPTTLFRRLFDLLIAAPVALAAVPVVAIAAIAIKLTDRGPVFYRQVRVGARGAHFEILKLRSMSVDAERAGVQFSRARDPRVTAVGRVLRRTHIDELPQIFNVIRGDMRLVGPRPERPEIVAEMERIFPHYSRRLLLKPGITGWAQVRCGYAGSTLGTAWKLCHDLYYLKRRSTLADLLIMFETIAIAAKDAHRPLRVPESQFLSGRYLGIDTTEDEAGGIDERDRLLPQDAPAA
jgi:lipopolysaccharide/colanic/teichoic acid biosynthesis glycosyltransferase